MIATKVNDKCYDLTGVGKIQREYEGQSPSGERFKGHWVMRNHLGDYIDSDTFINQLAERQRFVFERTA
jgi:hypothetical protein